MPTVHDLRWRMHDLLTLPHHAIIQMLSECRQARAWMRAQVYRGATTEEPPPHVCLADRGLLQAERCETARLRNESLASLESAILAPWHR